LRSGWLMASDLIRRVSESKSISRSTLGNGWVDGSIESRSNPRSNANSTLFGVIRLASSSLIPTLSASSSSSPLIFTLPSLISSLVFSLTASPSLTSTLSPSISLRSFCCGNSTTKLPLPPSEGRGGGGVCMGGAEGHDT